MCLGSITPRGQRCVTASLLPHPPPRPDPIYHLAGFPVSWAGSGQMSSSTKVTWAAEAGGQAGLRHSKCISSGQSAVITGPLGRDWIIIEMPQALWQSIPSGVLHTDTAGTYKLHETPSSSNAWFSTVCKPLKCKGTDSSSHWAWDLSLAHHSTLSFRPE